MLPIARFERLYAKGDRMSLLGFFCKFMADDAFRTNFVTAPKTLTRIGILREYHLTLRQIGMVLREDQVALTEEIAAQIAQLNVKAGIPPLTADSSVSVPTPAPAAEQAPPNNNAGLAGPAVVMWPGPIAVAIEMVRPAIAAVGSQELQSIQILGWHFTERAKFTFALAGEAVAATTQWVHTDQHTGQSWASVKVDLPPKGKWAVIVTNPIGAFSQQDSQTTMLPNAFETT